MKDSKVIRIVKYIDTTIFILTSSLLVLVTVYGVFRRYVMNNPITWLEELQMILIVQVSFFGGSIAFRERGHICVDVLVDTFSEAHQRRVAVIGWFLVFAALCLIGWQEVLRTIAQIKRGRVSNILRIPMYLNYAGVSFATLLMVVGHIANGIEDFILRGEVSDGNQ